MPDRYARHYFDTVRLLGHPQAGEMLANDALRERVVNWKSKVFARSWARYDLAQRGTFRLVPPELDMINRRESPITAYPVVGI
ncbi:hypothetical protein B9Z47_09545 [Limnohabitans sp. 2KL-1]|uniref:hypothetical protein n=1 Tax=Limnohabitans sp. 2KL-1 TaxID=1100699 RepID=UPI000DD18C21|nr:hypothetical protein B9Z47_09545 [Limnohabitans sp. 2KL-1]